MVQQIDRTAIDSTLVYPDRDGKPLADNTVQFRLIMTIKGGLDILFAQDPNVFVAGDLLWYPVEGALIRQAPDVMVVFGRPKGDRGSYQQWQESNIAPHVVFEILSPGNTRKEMARKFDFYQVHGVEEYYLYDPDQNVLNGWIRANAQLIPVQSTEGWASPRLGIWFQTQTGTLELYRPDGRRFETIIEMAQRAEQEAQARYAAIPKLLALGLSMEQVAETLGFTQEEVLKRI